MSETALYLLCVVCFSDLFDSYICDVDRGSVAVLAHVEFKTSVVIIFFGHVKGELECLPFGRKVDRSVREVADPAGIRG